MRVTPRSSADIEAEVKANAKKLAPWPTGTYDFEVLSAIDAVSNAGNDMIALELSVFNKEGERRTIKDWLLDEMAAKLRHAVEACGLVREYENGSLDAGDFIGKSGKVVLSIQPPKDGYSAKNNVRDYVSEPASARAEVRRDTKAAAKRAPVDDDLDDQIPF